MTPLAEQLHNKPSSVNRMNDPTLRSDDTNSEESLVKFSVYSLLDCNDLVQKHDKENKQPRKLRNERRFASFVG